MGIEKNERKMEKCFHFTRTNEQLILVRRERERFCSLAGPREKGREAHTRKSTGHRAQVRQREVCPLIGWREAFTIQVREDEREEPPFLPQ